MALSRRGFVRLLGGGTVLAASGLGLGQCDQMPASALAAWAGPDGAEKDARKRLIAWAILAPNPHNRQPWLLDLRQPDAITLYCDRTRLLPQTDPFSRQIMIGHGCFLELLDLAASASGLRADIVYFPDGAFADGGVDARPVARIALTPDPGRARDPLFDQIRLRRSNKQPYDGGRKIEAEKLAALAKEIAGSGMALAFAEADPLHGQLRDIATEAWVIEGRTKRTMAESVDLMRLSAAEIDWYRDGISLHGPMMWWGQRAGMIDKRSLLDPTSAGWAEGFARYKKMFDNTASFAWLASPGNDRVTQLKAGRAYARLNLRATALGLAQHPISQVLQEFPEMAALQKKFLAVTGTPPGHTVQMLFRLGYGPAAAKTPRRDPADLLLGELLLG